MVVLDRVEVHAMRSHMLAPACTTPSMLTSGMRTVKLSKFGYWCFL